MVIFDAKKLCHAWTANEVTGTSYGLSDNGWITTPLFEGWLADHFLKHAVAGRPLLLLLDGHSTHYQPEASHCASGARAPPCQQTMHSSRGKGVSVSVSVSISQLYTYVTYVLYPA